MIVGNPCAQLVAALGSLTAHSLTARVTNSSRARFGGNSSASRNRFRRLRARGFTGHRKERLSRSSPAGNWHAHAVASTS